MTRPLNGRGAFSREEIVEVARQLIRNDGVDALTMPRVADELGVTTMAVYYHVQSKDDLISHVHDVVKAEEGPLVLEADGWEASLHRSLLTTWSTYRKYPGLAAWRISRPDMPGTASHDESVRLPGRSYDENVRFFESAGFSKRDAVLAWSFAATYLYGRLSVEGSAYLPNRRARGALGARDHFEFSVEAIIAGITAACATAPKPSMVRS